MNLTDIYYGIIIAGFFTIFPLYSAFKNIAKAFTLTAIFFASIFIRVDDVSLCDILYGIFSKPSMFIVIFFGFKIVASFFYEKIKINSPAAILILTFGVVLYLGNISIVSIDIYALDSNVRAMIALGVASFVFLVDRSSGIFMLSSILIYLISTKGGGNVFGYMVDPILFAYIFFALIVRMFIFISIVILRRRQVNRGIMRYK